MEASVVKEKILSELSKSNNQEWDSAEIIFEFLPYANRGYKGTQRFWNGSQELKQVIFRGDRQLTDTLLEYTYWANQKTSFNKILVKARKKDKLDIEVTMGYDPEIDKEFENNLPKSMRGKTVPWWKNPAETRDYLRHSPEQVAQSSPEPPESFALSFLKEHLSRLPVQEAPLGEEALSGKTLPELYRLFIPFLKDEANPLWDGGLISISRGGSGQFSGKLIGYYYGSEEDRDAGGSQNDELPLPAVTEKMKSIYEAVQSVTRLSNPDMVWDRLIVSLYSDGFIEANYERDGEEVEF